MWSKISFISLLILLLVFGCGREDIVTTSGSRSQSEDSRIMHVHEPCTCSTAACIRDWVDEDIVLNQCPTLYVESGYYNLTGHFPFDHSPTKNFAEIIGTSPLSRPTLHLANCYTYGPYYATMHFQENVNFDMHTRLKDLIVDHSCQMQYGSVAGIQFEACSVELDNVKFTGGGTTHFLAPGHVIINDIELTSGCEFVTGHINIDNDQYWCGEPTGCGGPGPWNMQNGSEIKNSILEGYIKFEITHSDDTLYVHDNDSLTYLRLNVEDGGSDYPVVILADNSFLSGPGARVIIKGDYKVIASGNVTHKGTCYSKALQDFNTTNANFEDALTLESWIYGGTTYCLPEITNLDYNRNGNTVTVTWATECIATSKVIWGYSCESLTTTETGSDATLHEVEFTVPGNQGCIYLRAISAVPGDDCTDEADTSACVELVKDITIYNIQTSFNAFLCTFTVTWTTNVKSSSKVYYGASCSALNYGATGAGNTTSHSVVCDVSEVYGSCFAFKVKSDNSCDSAMSSCYTKKKGLCMSQ